MIHINEKYPLDHFINWEIKEEPVYNSNGDLLEGWKTIINDETKQPINIVRNSYTPVENYRLAEICKGFEETGAFKLKGFATYGGGQKVLGYLEADNPVELAGLKNTDYLVVGNSHDGSSSFFTGLTSVIHRCENMFSKTNKQNRLRHNRSIESELVAMEQTIDLFYDEQNGVFQQAEKFNASPFHDRELNKFVGHVLDIEIDNPDKLSTRRQNQIADLKSNIYIETKELGSSLWGAFNGVTRYTTHAMQQQKPVFGNPFNSANAINQRAFEYCKVRAEETQPRPQLVKPSFIEDVTPIEEVENPVSNNNDNW